ncbi:hypothetical protein MC885_012305 [Smutsia gigantea]|nr:hypothetical protein MC885_012305 [Smutsia gigantea]
MSWWPWLLVDNSHFCPCRIKVKSAEAQTLEQSHIEEIASSLGSQNQVPTEPLEELIYRRSLRVGLDVLNGSTSSCQESSSWEGRTALSPREKPTEQAPSNPCDPSSSSPSPQDVSDGAKGKARVHQRLSGSLTCGKDPKCKADQQQGLGKSESLRGLVVSSAGGPQEGSGSKTHRENRTTPTKWGRVSAQEPRACQNAPSLSAGGCRGASVEGAGSPASPSSPSRVGEGAVWAKGPDPGQPVGSPTALPAPRHLACPNTQGHPAKRRCPDGSQRPPAELEPGAAPSPKRGPRRLTTLKLGLPTLHVPAEETSPHTQEEGHPCSEESMEFGSVDSILEEDEEDEEPPGILLYPGEMEELTGAVSGGRSGAGVLPALLPKACCHFIFLPLTRISSAGVWSSSQGRAHKGKDPLGRAGPACQHSAPFIGPLASRGSGQPWS